MMTKIEEIEARLKAATPGPWRNSTHGDIFTTSRVFGGELDTDYIAKRVRNHDAEFIANAPTDIAWLLAEMKRLKLENECCVSRIKADRYVGECQ